MRDPKGPTSLNAVLFYFFLSFFCCIVLVYIRKSTAHQKRFFACSKEGVLPLQNSFVCLLFYTRHSHSRREVEG